ncbi:MAG TPA: zinc ABC transporter substrate-binding protein [Candidatus Limnocylindrales bacterium]|nr:zinc ABC transporter substrate-binding protein [Candidatus Limnocylindrales bacterium]
MKKRTYILVAALVAVVIAAVFIGTYLSKPTSSSTSPTSGVLQVVAGENFWGSLVSQLGGTHVQVLSIVTNPNADPHEYESSAADAEAIAKANYVIVNGAGYDQWALELISASNTPGQKVLNVANLLGQGLGSNPHFWYNPYYVRTVVHQMYSDLVALAPSDTSYFTQQYASLNASLAPYYAKINQIKAEFNGTEVASTESIFVYLANATGLDLVSPASFMVAVSEGTDPPAQAVVQFEQQLQSGQVKVLVYNNQTVTPLTTSMETIAKQNKVEIVGITETVVPSNAPFQDWMNSELTDLLNALSAKSG